MADILIDSTSREVFYVAATGETIDVQADKTMVTGGSHTRQFPNTTADSEAIVGANAAPEDFTGGGKFIYNAEGKWVINPGWTSYEDPDAVEATGLHYVVEFTNDLRTREVKCMDVDEDGAPSGIAQEEIYIYEDQKHVRTTLKKYDVDGDLIYEKTFDAKLVGESYVYEAL